MFNTVGEMNTFVTELGKRVDDIENGISRVNLRTNALAYAAQLGHPDAKSFILAAKEIEEYLSGMVSLDPTVLPE